MNKSIGPLIVASLCSFLTVVTGAETDALELQCWKSAHFLAPLDSSDHRKYAPDREAEFSHILLDVTPDFDQRTIAATATLIFKPMIKPLRELTLDAVGLNVESVASSETVQAHQVTEDHLIVTFTDPIAPDKQASLTVTYTAEPTQGIYFRTPEMGYKEGDTHLFTQGEPIEARYWYPCFDAPNEKLTSEIICRVPPGMTVISNGKLVSQETDAATGLNVVHWSQEKPHANYLITLVAGYFNKVEDRYNDVPLSFFTLPSESVEVATNSFRDTKDMMAFFEEEIGVPYPWPKYDQICINDFRFGGMENTSATTLTDRTLFPNATENIRSSEGLVAHELAHQWFGDLVTCKDWSHIWLNEGFATYYQSLYNAHKNGRDAMIYELYLRVQQITGMANDTNAIVRRTYDQPMDMFNYLAYPKGGWVLHMLRAELGEELYRQCIKTYLERHQYGDVVTEDLRAVIEELSGRSFDQFFDQWLYHAHHPELEVSYSWDEKTKLAKLSVKQVQKLGDNVLLFSVPLAIQFKGEFGSVDRDVRVTQTNEDFYFPLASAPKSVRLDPDYTLLAKIKFTLPNAMLYAQLADKDDMPGRLLAIEQLADKRDKEAVTKLKAVLSDDTFYGVRLESSKALHSIHTEEALDALLASTAQPDARVRRQVVDDIGGFYREVAYDSARQTLDAEKNPDILATAIRNLSGYAKPDVSEQLLKYLGSDSFRNVLADAAVNAMRSQDDPNYIEPLRKTLSEREEDFASRDFGQALRALAYLARNEDEKGTVRDFLLAHLNSKKETIQIASISALGTLGDPRAVSVLETYASASKETPQRAAAESAVAKLRADRKPVDDFKNLRQEVLDLQKTSRDLRKELDDLRKKVEAGFSTGSSKTSKRLSSPRDRR